MEQIALLILIAAIIFIIKALKVVPQQNSWVVERLGKFHAALLPGLNIVIPFIDRVAYKHMLKEVPLDVPSQICITRDNTQLQVDGILYFQVTDPKLGETILDPACGTGGFLTEAFQHLERQADTVEKRRILQEDSFFGGEAKSLPFLLSQLNLLLHGLHAPRIDPGNALRFRLAEIGEDQRVNVILTNPPFGGEEEAGILNNFPEDRRTAETALLFLQLIMRRLKRAGRGRAAVVVPHGTLFGDGISARIKADLLEKFNLHTVVRLREGVFAPYTDIPANLIFFDTTGPTKDIWYYEMPLPEGRKKYSKTAPMAYEEFADCLTWWKKREPNERAWKVSATDLIQRDAQDRVVACNLDIKNPHSGAIADHRAPAEIVDAIIAQEQRIIGIMDEIKAVLAERV